MEEKTTLTTVINGPYRVDLSERGVIVTHNKCVIVDRMFDEFKDAINYFKLMRDVAAFIMER